MPDDKPKTVSQPSYDYNKYKLTYVLGAITPEQKQRVIDFWRRNNALGNPQEANRRVNQVVMMSENEDNEVVGVTTVYPQPFIVNMRPFLYYRMFIQPSDRVFGMMEYMTQLTHQSLKDADIPNKPDGMVVVTENTKLMRKGMKRMLRRSNLEYIGVNNNNQDVWYWGFDKQSFPRNSENE
jgi:hypothetical protein